MKPLANSLTTIFAPSSSDGEGSSDTQAGESSHILRSVDPDDDDPEGSDRQHSVPVECLICSELADDNVILEPCKHKIACEECSSRMKKCIKCGTMITKRVTHGKFPLIPLLGFLSRLNNRSNFLLQTVASYRVNRVSAVPNGYDT